MEQKVAGRGEAGQPLMPRGMVELGQKNIEAMLQLQAEILAACQTANRTLLERLTVEAEITAELAAKLASTKGMPDAATAWQEWLGQHMGLLRDDGERLAADAQRLANASARILSNGMNAAQLSAAQAGADVGSNRRKSASRR